MMSPLCDKLHKLKKSQPSKTPVRKNAKATAGCGKIHVVSEEEDNDEEEDPVADADEDEEEDSWSSD
jgi:hypothetical protein